MAIVLRCSVYREILWGDASEAHVTRHGVAPGEVEAAINSRSVLTHRGRGGTTEIYRTSDAGRAMVTINERRAFRRKGR